MTLRAITFTLLACTLAFPALAQTSGSVTKSTNNQATLNSASKRAFMTSCAGFSRELVEPCQCILREIETRYSQKELEEVLAAPPAKRTEVIQSLSKYCVQ